MIYLYLIIVYSVLVLLLIGINLYDEYKYPTCHFCGSNHPYVRFSVRLSSGNFIIEQDVATKRKKGRAVCELHGEIKESKTKRVLMFITAPLAGLVNALKKPKMLFVKFVKKN